MKYETSNVAGTCWTTVTTHSAACRPHRRLLWSQHRRVHIVSLPEQCHLRWSGWWLCMCLCAWLYRLVDAYLLPLCGVYFNVFKWMHVIHTLYIHRTSSVGIRFWIVYQSLYRRNPFPGVNQHLIHNVHKALRRWYRSLVLDYIVVGYVLPLCIPFNN